MADTVLFLNIAILQCSLEVDEEKIIYMHMKIHEKMKKMRKKEHWLWLWRSSSANRRGNKIKAKHEYSAIESFPPRPTTQGCRFVETCVNLGKRQSYNQRISTPETFLPQKFRDISFTMTLHGRRKELTPFFLL